MLTATPNRLRQITTPQHPEFVEGLPAHETRLRVTEQFPRSDVRSMLASDNDGCDRSTTRAFFTQIGDVPARCTIRIADEGDVLVVNLAGVTYENEADQVRVPLSLLTPELEGSIEREFASGL